MRAELDLRADALDARWGRPGHAAGDRPPLETVYVGGGTPSLLPGASVASLLAAIRSRYGLANRAEVTLEVNPGQDERGDARAFRDAGVTRLSIGAQSLDEGELRSLGRRHRAADVGAAVGEARAAGIESASLDLLYDVPGQTLDSWRQTLEQALSLEPDHLSLYALTLDDPERDGLTGPAGDHLPTSSGARRWRSRARPLQDDDRAAEMYELADERLSESGYAWYEISNWARPGHRSSHNLGYWRRRPHEAVGPGAHAFDGRTRRWNAASIEGYLAALTPRDGSAQRLPAGGREAVDGDDALAEAAVLALRTAEGSAAMAPDAAHDPSAQAWLAERLEVPIEAGLVVRGPGGFVLSRRGRLLSNEVFTRLLPDSAA